MRDSTDYFVYEGYRKFAFQVLLQTLDDLLLPDEKAIEVVKGQRIDLREQAKAWINFKPIAGANISAGLRFVDCVLAIGLSSELERIREGILLRPTETRASLMNGISVMVNIKNTQHLRTPVDQDGLVNPSPKVGDFNASWLFKKPQPMEVAGA